MDYRTDSFARRFKSAQSHLGTRDIQDLVSLKYRDDPVNSSEYSHFIEDYIKQNMGLDAQHVDGDFGGQAWLVMDRARNRVILVEHETGLEILYVAGSVASLIALIPLISSGWTNLRHRFFRPHHLDGRAREGVEIRQFDKNETLVEVRSQSIEVYVLNASLRDYALLKNKIFQLEEQIKNLQKQLPRNDKPAKVAPKRKSSRKKPHS